MDDDIDFDDLLGEERAASLTAKRPVFDVQAAPSTNELRLGKRVLELEEERDRLAAEVAALRAGQATAPTVPIPGDLSHNPASTGPITIPHDLLPTLQLLKLHISDLTRENAALRYTFIGEPTAGPSRVTGTGASPLSPSATAVPVSDPLASLDQASISELNRSVAGAPGETLRAQGVDVEKVLTRVKALMLENEELGEMVLEAGRRSGAKEEWQKALEESRAVIESLDSDLTHHLATIQSLRAELKTAESQSRPPPSPVPPSGPSSRPTSIIGRSTPTAPTSSGNSLSIKGAGTAPRHHLQPGKSSSGHRETDKSRERDRERPRERIRDKSDSAIESGSGRGEKHRDREDKDGGKEVPRGPREDRDYKRRR